MTRSARRSRVPFSVRGFANRSFRVLFRFAREFRSSEGGRVGRRPRRCEWLENESSGFFGESTNWRVTTVIVIKYELSLKILCFFRVQFIARKKLLEICKIVVAARMRNFS